MKKTYVLDACGLIAFLKKEAGGAFVRAKFENALVGHCIIYLHKATLAEALYDLLRSGVFSDAKAVFAVCQTLPLQINSDLSDVFIEALSHFKNTFKVSFADCFVLALAKLHNAKVITVDHHEFDPIEQTGELQFEWIR